MPSKELANIGTDLLAKGINFSITSKTMAHNDKATIEDAGEDHEKEEADTICTKISLTLQNSKPKNDLSFKRIKYDRSIAILPVYEGRSTVIFNLNMCGSYNQWSITTCKKILPPKLKLKY